MTPEDRTFRATDARQLLENPLFVEAFESVANYLHAAALSCDPDSPAKALRIVNSQQLLAAIKREITRVVSDGAIAQVQISELEQKRNMMQRVFRR